MEKAELYELIEDYLDDTLPDDKRREVEQRMADDPNFREEVELHRALQEDYADPARWRFREALTEIMNEQLPNESPAAASESRQKWWLALSFVALVGLGIWFFKKSAVGSQKTDARSPTENIETTPQQLQSETKPTNDQPPPEPTAPTEKPKQTGPIAQADPARFQENRSLEAYLGETRSAEDSILVEMTTPKNASIFQPDENGMTTLRFSGTASHAASGKTLSLELQIFDNRDSRNAKRTLTLRLLTDASGKANFDFRELVDFPKGLYYFRIGEQESGQRLMMGKFFIGQL